MAITDIDISEELVTNAPSIKYTGNEGPKSPQEEQMIMKQQMNEMDQIQNQEAGDEQMIMEMAGGENNRVRELLLKEETIGLTEDEKEELRALIRTISAGLPEGNVGDMAMKSGLIDEYRNYKMGQEDAGEKFMSPRDYYQSQEQDRIGVAYGGIMGLDGRRKYGFGSKFKKFVRKIIPNEVAAVAEKAAPFIALAAPQFALPAAIAGGLGSFDRTGRIGSSLASGLKTYGLGQISPGLPGLRNVEGTGMFSKTGAMGGKYNLKNIMAAKGKAVDQAAKSGALPYEASEGAIGQNVMADALGGEATAGASNVAKKGFFEAPKKFLGQTLDKVNQYVPKSFGALNPFGENFDLKQAAGAFGIFKGVSKII